jgi:DNA-directed RNA polymerase specialized sigma24 family protein
VTCSVKIRAIPFRLVSFFSSRFVAPRLCSHADANWFWQSLHRAVNALRFTVRDVPEIREGTIGMESPEVLRAFLLWLGEDEGSGARKYEEIRRKLVLLFRYRGCYIPEELADETIDRTARAVMKPDFHYKGDQVLYFRGVARNVFLEWVRRERRLPTDPISQSNTEIAVLPSNPEPDLRKDCLEHCLNALPAAKKTLVIRYYRSEKREKIDGRQVLAEELGIGVNALRIQVFRIRNALRQCVANCETRGEILCIDKT